MLFQSVAAIKFGAGSAIHRRKERMKKVIAVFAAVCTLSALAAPAFAGETAPAQPEAQAYKMSDFTLDGKLDEWNKESPLVLNDATQVIRDVVFWNGPDDLSAIFYVGWDEDYFYMAADVTEDSVFGAIEMLPLDGEDNFEVFLSTDPTADPLRTEYGTNDFMFYLIMDGEYWDTAVDRSMVPKDNRMRYISQGMDGGENVFEGYECAAEQTAMGFTYECRIPWECFSNKKIEVYTPQAGDTVNFDVLVTDISYPCPGTEFIPQIAWTGYSSVQEDPYSVKQNPATWGRITFVE